MVIRHEQVSSLDLILLTSLGSGHALALVEIARYIFGELGSGL